MYRVSQTDTGTENMTIIGNVDTSDSTIIRWVTHISSRLPKLEWVSWTQTTPCIPKKIEKVIERTNHILDTLSTENAQQAFTNTFIHYIPIIVHTVLSLLCFIMLCTGVPVNWLWIILINILHLSTDIVIVTIENPRAHSLGLLYKPCHISAKILVFNAGRSNTGPFY